MRKLSFLILGLAFALPCFAGSLAEHPTIGFNFEKSDISASGSSISAGYFSFDAEIPAGKGNLVVVAKSGTNYGVSENHYKVGYRFEIK